MHREESASGDADEWRVPDGERESDRGFDLESVEEVRPEGNVIGRMDSGMRISRVRGGGVI